MRAQHDMSRCLVCSRIFGGDDTRENVYLESKLVGAIHDTCYDSLFDVRVAATPTSSIDTVSR